MEILPIVSSNPYHRRDDAGHISIEQYNREIDEALAEVATGNYITQKQMEKSFVARSNKHAIHKLLKAAGAAFNSLQKDH